MSIQDFDVRISSRDTNNCSVVIGSIKLYFSYDTLIAYTDHTGGIGSGYRLAKEHIRSQTTAKHLNRFGAKDWTPMTPDQLHDQLKKDLAQ